jgi:translation initiation factor 5B
MSDFTNDDLLNELSSMPAKKGKKKGGASKPKEESIPVEEPPKEEVVNTNTTSADNDDLLNELNSMPSSKKGKKKGAASKAKEEPVVEEPKKEDKKPEPVNEEPAAEKEDEDDEEGADEKGDETTEKTGEKKKRKVIKKKKAKKEDPLLKILQEQAKRKKELEEKLQREAEEAERREQEEEERRRKEEEERRAQEELARKAEADRLKELARLGIKSAADLKELDMKAQSTLENLKKQGFENMDDFLKSMSSKPLPKKIKKKAPEKKTDTISDKIDVYEPKATEPEPEEDQEQKVEPVNEELLKYAEKEMTININKDEALDDWENFDEEEASKPVEVKPVQKKEEINQNKNTEIETMDNKKNRTKTKDKKAQVEEEYVPTANLRAPIICILGHVDTGKTKILDKLRKTNVQEGEAGGITQQIGATYFPMESFKVHLEKIPEKFRIEPKIPGFLVIDTPGHESFQNLRSRGSGLCDLAVLVVDIMHGLQKQTLDSIELLRRRRTPFIIALNKIDRIYQWKTEEWGAFRDSFEVQKKNQTREFNDRLNKIIMQLVQANLNVALYDENPSMKEYINIVPTSAVTGEGMPDLIGMFVYIGQKFLTKRLEFKEEVQCTILEVKVLEGVGTTIDIILVNGTLKIGDKIVIGGLYGPIKTTIKMLLTPHPMKEMRVKSEYHNS